MKKLYLASFLVLILVAGTAGVAVFELSGTNHSLEKAQSEGDKTSVDQVEESGTELEPPFDESELEPPEELSGFKKDYQVDLGAGLGQEKYLRAKYSNSGSLELEVSLILYNNETVKQSTPSFKDFKSNGTLISAEKGEVLGYKSFGSYECIWHKSNAMFSFTSEDLNRSSINSVCNEGARFLSS
jgi:hypothetical protein